MTVAQCGRFPTRERSWWVIGLSFGQGDMATPILQTKLYVPPHRPRDRVVPRPRLIERLNAGLLGKLTLISAPAGFGKTTLLSEWVAGCEPSARFAWLSLPLALAFVGAFVLTGAIVFRIKRMRKETNDESSDWKHLSRVKYLYPVFDQEGGFLDPL